MDDINENLIIPKHGGNIYKEAKTLGISPDTLLDFSANINPLGIPSKLRDLLYKNIDNLINYPDPDCTKLKQCIGKYLDLPLEHISIGNGASEIIYLIFATLRFKNILIPCPSFIEYEQAAKAAKTNCYYFERREEDDFKIDFVKLIDNAIKNNVEAVLICNPNNPTSTMENIEEMINFIGKCKEKGIFVIVDEAFIELTIGANSNSLVRYIRDFDNLIIIRAFTKVFAVPGLRLGYGVSSKEIADKIEKSRITWSVNLLACEAGEVLFDYNYFQNTQKWLKEELDYLYKELKNINSLKVFKPSTNFVLVKIINTDFDAAILRQMLLKDGILIRHAGNFRFLDNSYFRVAVKDRSSNQRLIKAISNIFCNQKG